MTDFTKQDIQILMDGVQRWEISPDTKAIADEVLGCVCPNCCPSPDSLVQRLAERGEELSRRINEEIRSRQERSTVLRSKLLAMRDSIVADEFFASIPATPVEGFENA